MRILSLFKAAYDVPVTGKSFSGTKQQGLHSYNCSSFAIWSVQVSRLTGMVAYCSADSTVLCFQLTSKAVDNFLTKLDPPFSLWWGHPFIHAGDYIQGTTALCYGNDPGTESGPEEALTYSKSKKRPTCRSGNNNNREDDQALVCRDEEPSKTEGKENGKIEARTNEVFPLKMVAIHKVRWNMNKGSERWLCYGGAAGLVRCREIVLSNWPRRDDASP
ncbi:hypothetical protein CMV_002774 [Castanea mollissima]|uniref:Uncharacterized protein n=1 Tax=Castanea mollissima TaxID=60419 RepID=A0A8J4VVV2_9ROSI|nr:hypothetical protein CMV_002774 [Castanea mollissima]